MDIALLKQKAKEQSAENKKMFERLKKQKPNNLDEVVHTLHKQAFEHIDCLSCANCCKTTSPLFKQKDIERLASYFKIRPAEFIARYLHIDTDGDYVLNAVPCPFLADDNACTVYEHRPNACREYPHTHQRKIHTVLKETYENIAICPAVYEIVAELKRMKF